MTVLSLELRLFNLREEKFPLGFRRVSIFHCEIRFSTIIGSTKVKSKNLFKKELLPLK